MSPPAVRLPSVRSASTLTVLHLRRYGALSDVALPLGAGLTLVVGANEAGKSTTLAALGDLLWGLPQRTARYALVPRNQVRLEADLEDGTRVVRTGKGLLARDGLSPAAAHPWGGDAEGHRAAWSTAFGLDHAALRAGGQAVCRGAGDLAELVFTARQGQGVHELLERLRTRADDLYKEHRGNKGVAVRRALAAHATAREELLDATTRASRVVEAEALVTELRGRVEAAAAAELATSRDRATRERQQRCADDAARLRAVREALASARAEGPVLEQAALEAWEEAAASLAAVRSARAERREQVAAWSHEQERLAREPALLADGDLVEALQQQAEARAGDRARAQVLAERAERAEGAGHAVLDELTGVAAGATPLAERWAGLAVPADLAAQLDAAAEQQVPLAAAVAAAAARVADARAALHQARSGPELLDPVLVDPVEEGLGLLQAEGSPLQRWRCAGDAAAAATAARREHLVAAGSADPDGPVPEPPSADRVAEVLDRLTTTGVAERDRERDEHEAQQQVRAAEAALEGGAASVPAGDGPGGARLVALRAARDALWQQVRAQLVGATAPAADAAALAEDYAAAVAAADDGADACVAAAEADGAAAARRRELQERLDALRAARDALAPAHAEAIDAREAYAAVWARAGVAVPPPGRAEVVRHALEEARAAGVLAAQREAEAAAAAVEAGAGLRRLAALLAAAGRPVVGAADPVDGAPAEAVLGAARRLVAECDAGREARQELRLAAQAAAAAEDEHAAATAALAAWRTGWRELATAAGLPAVLDAVGWRRRRDLLERAGAHRDQAAAVREEAGAAGAAWAAWCAAVGEVAVRHGEPFDPTAPEAAPAAVSALWARVSSARRDEGVWEDRAARLAEAALAEAADDAAEARARAVLADLRAGQGSTVAGEGADDGEDAALLGRSRAVRDLLARERALLASLTAAAGADADVEEVVTSLAGLDAARLDQLARDAAAAAEAARAARDAARDELTTAQLSLDALVRGRSAAALRAVEQQHLAAVAEAAERYAVAHLQRTVLGEQLEAYAARHASPLLHAAGQLLERLTDGRWVGVAAVGGGEQRALEVVDGEGGHHPPSELSEGTADQVFLALRLAGIRQLQDERARAGQPLLPVVLDDTLMTFDDARAVRALEVLAELDLQVVVLTHHEHLGRLAEGLRRPAVTVTRMAPPAALSGAPEAAAVREAISLPTTAATAGRAASPSRRAAAAVEAPPCQEELPVGL